MAVAALLALSTVSAQLAAPSGYTGSGERMDFGSDSSVPNDGAGSAVSSGGSSWQSMPTTSTAAWNIDWSKHFGGLGSEDASSGAEDAGWPDYEDEPPVEVSFPDLDGSIEALARRVYEFDASEGFRLLANSGGQVWPGNCYYAYCVHVVFESDYGAMTPFDAFVLDRYESASGPITVGYDGWSGGGPMPLVLGRLSDETRAMMEGDWTKDVFNWHEPRRTTWTIHPNETRYESDASNPDPRNIDLTLSLKQLYTLLPGYSDAAATNSSDGPFYSDDPMDQLIVRVSAAVPGAFSGSSAMLPIVVNHTGSQLVDINLTSTLLYAGEGVNGGNEIQLTFKLSRRKYGGITPWFPAEPSDQCLGCQMYKRLPDEVVECFDAQLSSLPLAIEELLSWRNDRSSHDVSEAAETCFSAIASGEWPDSTNATETTRIFNGVDWVPVPLTVPSAEARMEILRLADAALRCWSESQCPLSGTQVKSDAQVVVLKHTPASARIMSATRNVSFSLQLGVDGTDGTWKTTTTEVFSGAWSADEIKLSLANAFPDVGPLGFDVDVWRYDNSVEIEVIEYQNERRMREYEDALRGGNMSSDSGSDAASAGDGELYTGDSPASSWPSNTSSSSSSSWSDQNAGGHGLQPPSLEPVPPLVITTAIEWKNIAVTPRVLAVLSGNEADMSYETQNQSLVLQVAPLDVHTFRYVPPPPSVDLSWSDEPEWMTNVRRNLPTFASNDSCGNCMDAFQACVFDLDCAYGVNEYVRLALRKFNLFQQFKIVNQTQGEARFRYQVDITSVLSDARKFFPPKGYTKWMDLVSCWTVQRCNLDTDRWINYKSLNEKLLAQPTVFFNEGTEIRVVAHAGEALKIDYNGALSSYKVRDDETVDSIAKLLQDYVLTGNPTAMDDLVISIDKVEDAVRIFLRWPNRDMSRLHINTEYATSSVTTKPVAVMIAANRTTIVDSDLTWDALQWSRLESWLDIFLSVPSSSFPRNDGPDGTNGNNPVDDASLINWVRPILPRQDPASSTSPLAVCWTCAGLLQKCLWDSECARAVRKWLPTLFPATKALVDTFNRAPWNDEVINGIDSTTVPIANKYRELVLAFASCLARNGCPVGVSNLVSNLATSVVPTTVQFEARRVVQLASVSTFRLAFRDLPEREVDQNALGLWEYFDVAAGWRGERVNFYQSNTDKNRFTFTGSFQALQDLKITNISSSSTVGDVVYSAAFTASRPTEPNWDFILMWFRVIPAETSPPCPQCLYKLGTCYANNECWRSVQDSVVPILERRTDASLPWTSSYDTLTGQRLYKLELGPALYALISNVSPIAVPAFTTPLSWTLFTDILTCFAASSCDVETMDSALEPPATAHVPSYLKLSPATVQLLLYLNSQVRIDFNGQSVDYSETATGSTDGLKSTLATAFSGTNIPYFVNLLPSDQSAQGVRYEIKFGDAYFGRLPQFTLVARGDASTTDKSFVELTPWKVNVQSVDQLPQWDQLSKSLSSPPPPPSTPPDMSMFQCDSAVAMRSTCYASYECMSLLSAALPLMKNQIRTTLPNYNQGTRTFEMEFGWLLDSQLFSSYTNETVSTFLDVVRESARCATQKLDGSAPQPVFSDVRLWFLLPARGDVHLSINSEFLLPDNADPTVDRIASFEQFVYDSIAKTYGPNVGATHRFSYEADGATKHEFEFARLYPYGAHPYPVLFVHDMETQLTISSSTVSPWKLTFRSPRYAFNDACTPWLTWLSVK